MTKHVIISDEQHQILKNHKEVTGISIERIVENAIREYFPITESEGVPTDEHTRQDTQST